MSTFLTKITTYINQGEQIKAEHPEIWKSKYDDDLENLRKILNKASINESAAQHIFNLTEISKSQTFGNYIQKQDVSACAIKFASIAKQSKTKKICKACGESDIIVQEGVFVCRKCGAELISKSQNQLVAKENSDSSKHLMKQLKILTNESNPPMSITKIIRYIRIWFLDKSYIKSWLSYRNTFKEWFKKYKLNTGIKIDMSYFDEQFKQGVDNLIHYKVFKMFTDEFYNLTLLVTQYNEFDNNMSDLTQEQQLEILQAYYSEYKKIPEGEEKFKYKLGNEIGNFDVGRFIIKQQISDIEAKTEFKQKLNQIFGHEIKLPGLMFNYIELYDTNRKEKIPKKFTYQQNYVFIIHEVFNIPFYNILEADKQQICQIMLDFNNYLKLVKREQTGKNHNSCLWQISLSCVLKLPFFRCYADIIKILPVKESITINLIKETWDMFLISHHDELEKFTNILRKEKPDDLNNMSVKIINEQINTDELMDFINETGEKYEKNSSDKYLKEKLHIKDTEETWTKNFILDKDEFKINAVSNDFMNDKSNSDSEEIFSNSESEQDDQKYLKQNEINWDSDDTSNDEY